MDERYLSDLINCDIEDKEKMIEAVKEKLRWYTFEASEEEFDPEAVDMLVRFLQDEEPELGKVMENEDAKDKGCDKGELERKKRVIPYKRGKIAAAVVIGILTLTLASVIVGNSLGDSLAWENGGFFRWLQRDKDGQTMITSPEDLGMEDGNVTYYEKISDVPEEYQRYLLLPIDLGEVKEIDFIRMHKAEAFLSISEILLIGTDERIECGVTIFEDKVRVVRDSYDGFTYNYTIEKNEKILEIYTKENNKRKVEYEIVSYEDNMKFFVIGQLELDVLIDFIETYRENYKTKKE